MRRAMTVTREGILRMMRASHPGMYEYEYKAEFDYALTSAGVLEPAFHSIIPPAKTTSASITTATWDKPRTAI